MPAPTRSTARASRRRPTCCRPSLSAGARRPRCAARFGDAWLPMWMDPEQVAAGRARLAELAAEHGRPAPGVALVAFVNAGEQKLRARAEAADLVRRQY